MQKNVIHVSAVSGGRAIIIDFSPSFSLSPLSPSRVFECRSNCGVKRADIKSGGKVVSLSLARPLSQSRGTLKIDLSMISFGGHMFAFSMYCTILWSFQGKWTNERSQEHPEQVHAGCLVHLLAICVSQGVPDASGSVLAGRGRTREES